MTENKTCKGCKWNAYPICNGTILENGDKMRIDNLRPVFNCGVKDMDTISDSRPVHIPTELELLREEVNELKGRITELELKK